LTRNSSLPLVYKIRLDYWFVEKVSTWQVSRSAVMARHGSMAAGMMVPRLVLALLLPVAVTALDNGLAITREAMSSPVAARWLCAVCAASCVSSAGCGPAIHHAGRQIARSSLDQLCWGNRGNRLPKKASGCPYCPYCPCKILASRG
jgi:hypothetical protein